jgi:hypothetical protein
MHHPPTTSHQQLLSTIHYWDSSMAMAQHNSKGTVYCQSCVPFSLCLVSKQLPLCAIAIVSMSLLLLCAIAIVCHCHFGVAGGWWLVAGGWWLVAGERWWLVKGEW